MALTLKFEVAFNAGYATAAGSRTWTDITSYVVLSEGVEVKFGGTDPLTTTEPNTLSLTLDNRDGRFTPERSSSPYYPNVKLFRPIRVTATLPDASTSVRFLGYVTEWPTTWPDGSDAYSAVTIKAQSRMARLGQTTQLRSMVANEILAASPIVYYPLGEESSATSAANVSTTTASPLTVSKTGVSTATPNVVFGNATGPAGDGQSAPTFDGTGCLMFPFDSSFGVAIKSISAFVLTPSAPASEMAWLDIFGDPQHCVFKTSGHIEVFWGTGAVESPTSYADGHWHCVVVTNDGSTVTLYVDGVSVATSATASALVNLFGVSVGGPPPGNGSASGISLTGSVAHVAAYPNVLTAQQASDIYTLGMGTLTETTSSRAMRIAGYGGVTSAEVSSSGAVTVGAQDASGKTVLDALRDVEATEAGVLYDARDGTLTLASRSARYGATTAFTLDVSAQQLGDDYAPTYDASKLVNDATGTGPTTSARVTDASSVADYGAANASVATIASSTDEPQMLAGWLVNNYAQPSTRVSSLTVDVLPLGSGTPSVMNVAAATVGTLIGISNLPTQAAGTSASYFIEGYTERFSPESWEITFNVSPASAYVGVWTVEDATYGALTDNPIAL